MLVPVLLSKLPDEFKLIITRNFGKNNWEISLILESYKAELEVRERIVYIKIGDDEPFSTGHSLFNETNKTPISKKNFERRCVFYDNRNHKPQNCKLVTRPQARKRILSSKRCCFICMRQGHLAKDCKSSIKCFACHHLAICFSEKQSYNSEKQSYNN